MTKKTNLNKRDYSFGLWARDFVKKTGSKRSHLLETVDKERWKIVLPSAIKIADIDTDFEPPTNTNEWVIIKEQSYLPNKEGFIVSNFKKAFTNVTLPEADDKAYELITSLASRSSVISQWLAKANLEYSLDSQMPLYLRELVTPNEYNNLTQELQKYNKVISEFQQKRQTAATTYQNTLKGIAEQESRTLQQFGNNSYITVLSLPSTALPLTLQVAIENYTPANDNVPTKKAYMREILTNYKIYLLKELKKNPKIDIHKIIEDNKVK